MTEEGTYAPDDWSTYGWGTPAWVTLMKTALQATSDSGLLMDFAMGPNQGQGVPAVEGSEGLAWDIALYNASVPIGDSFNGTLPGWGDLDSTGNWTLLAATIGLLTSSKNTSSTTSIEGQETTIYYINNVLSFESLADITNNVQSDGTISYQFPDADGIKYYLFAVSNTSKRLIHDLITTDIHVSFKLPCTNQPSHGGRASDYSKKLYSEWVFCC